VISSLIDPTEQLIVLSKAIRVFYDHANFTGGLHLSKILFIASLHIHVPHSATEEIYCVARKTMNREAFDIS
jgi:hypothetical protein